jgi:hypothetical protein
MMQLILELASTCKPSKLDKSQRDRAAALMRQLRVYGFTNRELHVLAGGRISEPTIKRGTRNLVVKDTTEHDKVIGMLRDFALGGNTLKDLDDYKVARETLSGLATFGDCVKMATNLTAIGADLKGLLELSGKLAALGLQAPAIRKNIDLNNDLAKRGLTPEIQEKIRETAEKYGSPERVLDALKTFGDIDKMLSYERNLKEQLSTLTQEEAASKRRKEDYDAEALRQKTFLDIVRLLVADYSYDYSSLKALHELAGKYGDPLQVMGAVNAYGNLEQIKARTSDAEAKLRTLEEKVSAADARLGELNRLIEAADMKLGEIRANQAMSFRLQMVSDLLTNPRRLQATPEEMARLTLSFLNGLAEHNRIYPSGSSKFDGIVKTNIEFTIMNLQNYLRG